MSLSVKGHDPLREVVAGPEGGLCRASSESAGDRRTVTSGLLPGNSFKFHSTSSLPVVILTKVEAAEKDDPALGGGLEPRSESGERIPLSNRKSRCGSVWRSDSFILRFQASTLNIDNKADSENAATRPPLSAPVSAWDVDSESKTTSRQQRTKTRGRSSSFTKTTMRSSLTRTLSMEWLMQKPEIYNVASTKLRSILQAPAMSLDLKGVPEGVFAGPLLEIFPDSSFPRPTSRVVNQAEWDEVMGVGKWRYPAEDSGASSDFMLRTALSSPKFRLFNKLYHGRYCATGAKTVARKISNQNIITVVSNQSIKQLKN